MTWAQRLKRVFDIDIETCNECGGDVRIIASIEDPVVIRKILTHLDEKATTALLPECRAPPARGCLTEGMSPTRLSAGCSRLRSGMAGFTPGVGIGLN